MKGSEMSSSKKAYGMEQSRHNNDTIVNELMFILNQTEYSQKNQTVVRVEDFTRQQSNQMRLTQLLNYLQHFLGILFERMSGEVLTMERLQLVMRHWQLVPAHLTTSQLKSVDSSQSSWMAALKVLHQMGALAVNSQQYLDAFNSHHKVLHYQTEYAQVATYYNAHKKRLRLKDMMHSINDIDCLKVIQMDINFLGNEFMKDLERESQRLEGQLSQLRDVKGAREEQEGLEREEELGRQWDQQLIQVRDQINMIGKNISDCQKEVETIKRQKEQLFFEEKTISQQVDNQGMTKQEFISYEQQYQELKNEGEKVLMTILQQQQKMHNHTHLRNDQRTKKQNLIKQIMALSNDFSFQELTDQSTNVSNQLTHQINSQGLAIGAGHQQLKHHNIVIDQLNLQLQQQDQDSKNKHFLYKQLVQEKQQLEIKNQLSIKVLKEKLEIQRSVIMNDQQEVDIVDQLKSEVKEESGILIQQQEEMKNKMKLVQMEMEGMEKNIQVIENNKQIVRDSMMALVQKITNQSDNCRQKSDMFHSKYTLT